MKIRTNATPMVELLQETVEVWQAKLDQNPSMMRFGVLNCPLCRKYYTNDCQGCPISTYTGHQLCLDTPYEDVMAELKHSKVYDTSDAPVQKAIKKEITFLTKLLHIYRDIEAHEHSMALAEQTDNAYHISGRYAQDLTILNNLKARTKKGQD